ncbi:MAG: peptidoglycan-binding protein [Gemmobacter sp.]|jgi:hypothetical protein|nr:peptidoglycan-binding protein [Gemmobacter sp.]
MIRFAATFPAPLFPVVLTLLCACQPGGARAPEPADLSAGLLRVNDPLAAPPADRPGICWATDVTPAIFETVSNQVLVSKAVTDDTGRVLSPAVYRTETHQRMVKDREGVHFRSPCPAEMTVEFVASLQRALKARGYYLLPVTGRMDGATSEAIRRFQAPLGLDSPVISLEGARALGLVAADRKDL